MRTSREVTSEELADRLIQKYENTSDGKPQSDKLKWKLAWKETEKILVSMNYGFILHHNAHKDDVNQEVLKLIRAKCIEVGYVRSALWRVYE